MTHSVSRPEVIWLSPRSIFLAMYRGQQMPPNKCDTRLERIMFVEMFRWQRPDDFSPGEPSEGVIWDAIDRHDPRGDADVRDRLEQHQDMLQGSDTFHSFFTRSPLLPQCSEDSVQFEDPDRWVTSLRLQCGEYHSLESSVAQVGWGTCDILAPAADTVEHVGQSGLLSHRQLQSAPLEWPRDYIWTSSEPGQRLHLLGSLRTSGTPSRGTCWVGAEELTLTLTDLQTVSGLPVFGHPFEECVPPDEQLFSRVPSADGDRRGRLVLPDVYPVLLEHYRRVYRASGLSARAQVGMPVDVWLRSFLQDSYLTVVGASVHDPFGLDLPRGVPLSEEATEPSLAAGYLSPVLPGVTEDLFLVGFLATWLCTFVLPLRAGFVCYSALLATSQLSQGQRLSLAPAVLARIYRSLRTASEATSLELRDLTLPWHYLYGWIHLHILGAFSCLECPLYFVERGYPTVLQLSQASATLESERIRLFFFAPHLVADRFSLVYQPDTVSLPPHLRGTVVVDRVDRRGRRTLLLRRQSLPVAEYFVSMRPDTRRMDTVPLETRLYAAALTWLHLLRFGTGSSFLLAQPSAQTGVSYTRLAWVRQSFGPVLEHGARRDRHIGHTTARVAVPSSPRATGVAPEPLYTETARSPRRHTSSPRASSPRMPVGVHTSPGRASSPRMPVGVHTSPRGPRESSPRLRSSDLTSFSTLDPPDDYFCPVYPGESSGAGADIVAEFSFFPEGHPTDFAGPSSAPASFPAGPASPSTALEGFEYASEISCHVPFLPDSRSADRLLGLLASFGVSTTELVFWESLCRALEYQIRRLRDLSVLRTRVTLPELEERVTRRREVADDTHDRFDNSAVALRRHRESSSRMETEVSELTTRVRSLWRDIKEVMSKKTDVEERRGRRDRLTSREEQRYLALQQEMVAADSSLTQAVEELQAAQLEFQTLDEVTVQLESLQARLY
ncbi:hypothetical protein M5K25_019262 [Dendrobium thyrsiflorum]|uniref:Aminotransferase-like plant mobile domain-containing protein n=1 Tax=Dendrobium thyrsiflorum TaxID=117978 RepID=A0ABD0UEX5_DENTH